MVFSQKTNSEDQSQKTNKQTNNLGGEKNNPQFLLVPDDTAHSLQERKNQSWKTDEINPNACLLKSTTQLVF